jgi:hypothetical protein
MSRGAMPTSHDVTFRVVLKIKVLERNQCVLHGSNGGGHTMIKKQRLPLTDTDERPRTTDVYP